VKKASSEASKQKPSAVATTVTQISAPTGQPVHDALELLDLHYESFKGILPCAEKYGHPHPTDTRGWSQIIVSALTGILGLKRKKGNDLEDGSDVKAASTWAAIDTPRFNGVIKAGTKGPDSGKDGVVGCDTASVFRPLGSRT
jgi:hypothetical protein